MDDQRYTNRAIINSYMMHDTLNLHFDEIYGVYIYLI